MDGLEFIDNHLSICFSFYNFHLNLDFSSFALVSSGVAATFSANLSPTQEADNSRLFTSERAFFEPFLLLDAGVHGGYRRMQSKG